MNPYTVLGLDPATADDAAVRGRYLDLTREAPPEQFPDRAAAVRAAYDAVKDVAARAHHRLFLAGADATVDDALETLTCQTPRPRWTLDQLLAAATPTGPPPS